MICLEVSPRLILVLMLNGIDIPTMNKKAGNTTSGKLIASTSAGMCLSHAEIPLIPCSSLTITIRKKVMPRNASIDKIRADLIGESLDWVVIIEYAFST